MASIKKLSDRKFKITISNGYRPNGKKICKAKTITVPDSVKPRGRREQRHADGNSKRHRRVGVSAAQNNAKTGGPAGKTVGRAALLDVYKRQRFQIPHYELQHFQLHRIMPIQL